MTTNERISTLIKNLRTKRNLTVAQLAERAGVSIYTIYRIEDNRGIPRTDTLDLIFKALNYKYILGGKYNG